MDTHRQVEALIDAFMKEQGWERLKLVKWEEGLGRPDRVYARGEDTVIMELKPEYISLSELQRGIGQALFFSLYKAKIYLILSQSIWDTYSEVLKLGSFGVFTYRDMAIKKYASPVVGDFSLGIEKFVVPSLSRKEILEALKECSGAYTMERIIEVLHGQYPGRECYPSVVGRHLMSMGFGKGRVSHQGTDSYLFEDRQEGAKPVSHHTSKSLKREEVFEVVKEFKPGPYSMNQILESLGKFYPGREIVPSIVGKHLMSMGFGKGFYNPETMERANQYEGTPFYLINLHQFLGSNRAKIYWRLNSNLVP